MWAIILILLVVVCFPFIWTFLTSIKFSDDFYTSKLIYFPKRITFSSYSTLMKNHNFLKNMGNSSVVAICTATISITISTMAAYSFARFTFRGRKTIMSGLILIYMFPQVLLMIPMYLIMRSLGLLNTFWSLVLAYSTFSIPFATWLMTGFLKQIPVELEEAAKIDGCNGIQSFFSVTFPVLLPGLVATGAYIIITSWNEYLYAVMFTNNATETITVALTTKFITMIDIKWDVLSAGIVVSVIPIITIFIIFQKNIISGLTEGAVKG